MNLWTVGRVADCILVVAVFIFQQTLLNLILISHESGIFLTSSFFWFLPDFFVLLTLSYSLYVMNISFAKRPPRAISPPHDFPGHIRPSSRNSTSTMSEYTFPSNLECMKTIKEHFGCITWMCYSVLVVIKVAVLFKWRIPQNLKEDEFLGRHMLKFAIGSSALLFTLFVQAHKTKLAAKDPTRNAFINAVSTSIALDILDSASFVSLLIGAESHLIYPYGFENMILYLSSLNVVLPALTVYKLSATAFGRTHSPPLETLYKVAHLFLINGSYLGVRIYLWSMFHVDTSIFIIKNVYSMVGLMRELSEDILAFRDMFYPNNRQRQPNVNDNEDKSGAIPLTEEKGDFKHNTIPTPRNSTVGIQNEV